MDQALIEELEKDLARWKSDPSMANRKEVKITEENLSKLKAHSAKYDSRLGLRCDVPNNKCCYFCLKEKTCLHEHKVRQETYGGAILGGMMINVNFFSYQVCDACQKKLWARGILMLLCASLLGGVCGFLLSLLMKINYPNIHYVVKGVCVVCYLAAVLSLFNKHGQIRMHILWFFATVLFVMISFPLILHLRSLSITSCICVLMALSFPTILFGLQHELNLFSKLYGRAVY
jgi:hypothetical protein